VGDKLGKGEEKEAGGEGKEFRAGKEGVSNMLGNGEEEEEKEEKSDLLGGGGGGEEEEVSSSREGGKLAGCRESGCKESADRPRGRGLSKGDTTSSSLSSLRPSRVQNSQS